jgi:hypothetical protein
MGGKVLSTFRPRFPASQHVFIAFAIHECLAYQCTYAPERSQTLVDIQEPGVPCSDIADTLTYMPNQVSRVWNESV